jgi:type 1 glutamine amidotransferase
MKKYLKIFAWSIFSFLVLIIVAGAFFFYKVQNGFPVFYETEKPSIEFPANQIAVLVFSKTTGFRHGESIEASLPVINKLGEQNHFFVYTTEEGGVFNDEQLQKFDLVIFDNSTGRVLNDEQQGSLEKYVEKGGALMGIHGAGDGSHHWSWYQKNLLGAQFSHHPLNPQFQEADLNMYNGVDSLFKTQLPKTWKNIDEWYIYYTQPEGVNILYSIDGDKIIPDGNMLWIKDKNFGMGKVHPVAWYKEVGKGKTFFTSMGHSKDVWNNPNFVKLIEQGINWSIQ